MASFFSFLLFYFSIILLAKGKINVSASLFLSHVAKFVVTITRQSTWSKLKNIKQNWARPENFGTCFYTIFDCFFSNLEQRLDARLIWDIF